MKDGRHGQCDAACASALTERFVDKALGSAAGRHQQVLRSAEVHLSRMACEGVASSHRHNKILVVKTSRLEARRHFTHRQQPDVDLALLDLAEALRPRMVC